MKITNEIRSLLMRELGRKGGNACLKKHGKAKLREWGKMGGRPVSKTTPRK